MDLLGKAADKGFWAQVRENDAYVVLRADLLSVWNADCQGAIEAIPYSLFRVFWTTGDRVAYERMYFRRRRALRASALLSLIYPEEEKYLIRLMDEICAICDEYTWTLPACLPSIEHDCETFLDLFSCETGFYLAQILTLLQDRMEPLVCARVRSQVDRRIVRSYCEGTARYHWIDCTNNWAAVCGGSIGCTLMLLAPERFELVLPRIDATMACFLAGFGEDGICQEGFSYWHYGFGYFVVYADMLRTYTGGKRDYFADPKVKEIASFVQKAYLRDGVTVSFSDGSREGRFDMDIDHYLKNEYPDVIRTPDPAFGNEEDRCTYLRAYTWLRPEWCHADPVEDRVYYAEDAQWLIRQAETYGFAAKAGFNEEPHNHNDVGSFIFAKGGRQCLVDIGAAVYTRQYFTPERYDLYIEASSLGHSVPVIDGIIQRSGVARRARDVRCENGVFSFDMAGAYEAEQLQSAYRTFRTTDTAVVLEDGFAFSDGKAHEVRERFVTMDEPVRGENTVTAGAALLRYDGANVAEVKITTDKTSKNETLYFIDFLLKTGADTFRLIME